MACGMAYMKFDSYIVYRSRDLINYTYYEAEDMLVIRCNRELKRERKKKKSSCLSSVPFHMLIFLHYFLDFNSHIPSATCTGYTQNISKVVYLFFYFQYPKRSLPTMRQMY